MKKIQKVCLSLFMSSVLLASGVISKAINCDVVLSGDEIMPTDLYDVDFDQALQKNLKSAAVFSAAKSSRHPKSRITSLMSRLQPNVPSVLPTP